MCFFFTPTVFTDLEWSSIPWQAHWAMLILDVKGLWAHRVSHLTTVGRTRSVKEKETLTMLNVKESQHSVPLFLGSHPKSAWKPGSTPFWHTWHILFLHPYPPPYQAAHVVMYLQVLTNTSFWMTWSTLVGLKTISSRSRLFNSHFSLQALNQDNPNLHEYGGSCHQSQHSGG